MPIRNCSILPHRHVKNISVLPIRIIHPDSKKSFRTYGIIDTGASQCAIPGELATALGHNLTKGKKKGVLTGKGLGTAYLHPFTIEILHPQKLDKQIIHTLDNVLIDCMPHLSDVLLGVEEFLSNYILDINYPKRRFSLIK